MSMEQITPFWGIVLGIVIALVIMAFGSKKK